MRLSERREEVWQGNNDTRGKEMRWDTRGWVQEEGGSVEKRLEFPAAETDCSRAKESQEMFHFVASSTHSYEKCRSFKNSCFSFWLCVSAVMQQYTLQLIVFNYLILILHKVWEHQGDCVHVYLLSANKNSSVFFCMCASERAPQRQRLQMAVKQWTVFLTLLLLSPIQLTADQTKWAKIVHF